MSVFCGVLIDVTANIPIKRKAGRLERNVE